METVARESGFINSQPCIAEFITDITSLNDTFSGSSIRRCRSPLQSYCQSATQKQTDISSPVNSAVNASALGASALQASASAPKTSPSSNSSSPASAGAASAASNPSAAASSTSMPALKLPHYPWMKEKKTSRKGDILSTPSAPQQPPPPPLSLTDVTSVGEYSDVIVSFNPHIYEIFLYKP